MKKSFIEEACLEITGHELHTVGILNHVSTGVKTNVTLEFVGYSQRNGFVFGWFDNRGMVCENNARDIWNCGYNLEILEG